MTGFLFCCYYVDTLPTQHVCCLFIYFVVVSSLCVSNNFGVIHFAGRHFVGAHRPRVLLPSVYHIKIFICEEMYIIGPHAFNYGNEAHNGN